MKLKTMKATVILLIACVTTAFAQGTSAPQAVQNAFNQKYPNVKVSSWDREDDGKYEAKFQRDGKTYEAKFGSDGKWMKTERDISRADVPKAVWDALAASEYGSWKVDEGDIDELETPEHAKLYKIEVERGEQEYKLYFTPQGKLVDSRRDD